MSLKGKNFWIVAAVFIVLVALAAPTEAGTQRLKVKMDQPFQIADQLFEKGEVEVRVVRQYSPVATLSEITVDGESQGVQLAQMLPSGSAYESDQFVFGRADDGHLVFRGFAFKGERAQILKADRRLKD